ncbi:MULTISPECIES: NlpC/P60 family peptidoglycan endopeptidase RipA [Mycobacteriaceae]|uniref:Cell wall-associated hydrolase, NlpC family n=1 Tax=Mycolicibacterium fluoranthenivorans TaxID=258505 RepID=A0A1G4WD02_9MYCO|nr:MULTISPECIES: NlpC/P60 family peptidoglycan endopeptidase RipA [Mycobacteriaceae]MCV7256537.1 NlpC/P60 family peptidoglycan endopeptidase RipA [Mycobacterium hackensackense]SCX20609.1 Cell wall-associated hydrolase, NlpC family [Mycolicibacterium fluoranthenivorans]
MRRTPGASRLCGRACAIPLTLGVLLAGTMPHGAIAGAEPNSPEGTAALVAAVADADQKLQDLGAAVQTQQESVNKALVDVANARDNVTLAQQKLDETRRGVTDADARIADAQKRFDTFAAATYVNGPSASYLTAADPAEALRTAAAGQALAVSSEQVMADLQRARTEQINRESAARLAKDAADKAAADAQSSQDAAVASLTQAKQTFGAQQQELDKLTAERAAAQAKLAAARPQAVSAVPSAVASGPPAPSAGSSPDWDRAPGKSPAVADTSQWDTTLPMIPSAFVSGDPIQIINAVLGIMNSSAQMTANMGRTFLQKLGLIPTPSGYTNNGAIPRVYGRQASEYVIKRAMSQMGVPYSWGGGTAAGPSRGIDSGAGTTGFDCSGLILYAFAGVGIKLPHYSGSQYDMGRKIPSAEMRRGDVIFYGPGGSQHVTLYLGNGQMLEAPYTGSTVKVSPVRTGGMTPYVIRYIEY